jgi:hypothetical protein
MSVRTKLIRTNLPPKRVEEKLTNAEAKDKYTK